MHYMKCPPLPLRIRTVWNNPLWSPLEKVLAGFETQRLSSAGFNPPQTANRATANVDPVELVKFESAAPQWWDPKGPSGALHHINPLRLQFIQGHCPLAKRQVLDVGCGGGLLAEALARAGADVTGIDQGATALAVAKGHARDQGLSITYRQATAEAWAGNQKGRYDIVACMELLEHVPDPKSVVSACAELVTSGGWVVFATLNRNVKSYLFAICAGEYLLNLLPPKTHDWRRFVPPEELARKAGRTGLKLAGATGISYNPLTRIYRLSADLSVNYMLAFRKPTLAGNQESNTQEPS